MADYGIKYHFRWESQNGNDYQIDLLKKDYTGEVYERALGQAPVLRREMNDHIWGSSLEMYVECQVDQEFADLYSPDPYMWQVRLYDSTGTCIWKGFSTPELYSEPDIAPPYDVQIIATDGIGSLKYTDFALANVSPYGTIPSNTLQSVLAYLIGLTGFEVSSTNLPRSVGSLSAYATDGASHVLPMYTLIADYDHFDGETCYEVLESLLELLNAYIFQTGGVWYILRESDLNNDSFQNTTDARKVLRAALVKKFDGTSGTGLTWPKIQSMTGASDWWPVGQLTSEIEPAKSKVTVSHTYRFRDYMNTDALFDELYAGEDTWTKTVTSGSSIGVQNDSWNGSHVYMTTVDTNGTSISQIISWPGYSTSNAVKLIVKATTLNERTDLLNQEKSKLKVKIKNYDSSNTYYLTKLNTDDSYYTWTTSSATVELSIDEGNYSDTDGEHEIVIPATIAGSIEITIYGAKGRWQRISEVALVSTDYAQASAGERAIVSIGNNARSEDDEISIDYSIGTNAMAAADKMREDVMKYRTVSSVAQRYIASLSGYLHTSEGSFCRFLAIDRAIQVALPRLVIKGTLNVPAGSQPPMGFFKADNAYLLKTYSWDLYEDELEIEAISLPSTTIDTTGWTVTEEDDE